MNDYAEQIRKLVAEFMDKGLPMYKCRIECSSDVVNGAFPEVFMGPKGYTGFGATIEVIQGKGICRIRRWR